MSAIHDPLASGKAKTILPSHFVSATTGLCKPRACYPIRKVAGCTCAGDAWNVFPCSHRLQRKPLVSDPGMHHGMCVTHMSWSMSRPLTHDGAYNGNFTYLTRGPCMYHAKPWSKRATKIRISISYHFISYNVTEFAEFDGFPCGVVDYNDVFSNKL